MLRVDNSKPCKIVYSLCKHEFLGYLIEPHIVQLNPDGDFSLTYQRLFTATAKEFSVFLAGRSDSLRGNIAIGMAPNLLDYLWYYCVISL